MDPHSEVEVKFKADDVSVKDYHAFVTGHASQLLDKPSQVIIESFKCISGVDSYYVIGDKVVRYRQGGDRETELTYKARKSEDSITDRVEINVPIKMGTDTKTVKAFLEALGGEAEFHIHKTSLIYRIRAWIDMPDLGLREVYEATLALYDVDQVGNPQRPTRRFLEVEIESSSKCSPKVAVAALELWTKRIRKKLGCKKPLNTSLYEIYSKV